MEGEEEEEVVTCEQEAKHGEKEGNSTLDPPLSLAPPRDLPHYLEPYRSVLPPSLMPASRDQTAYPHVLLPDNDTGWRLMISPSPSPI